MKIAILGGSFDPVHLGHKKIVDLSLNTLDIDKLIIVPAFLNPFKTKSYAPASLRLSWLTKLFKNYEKVEISSFEIDKNAPSPSIDTVEEFSKLADKIYFIIGADNLKNLTKWKSFEKLDKMLTWVLVKRRPFNLDSKYKSLDLDMDISSTLFRKNLKKEYLVDLLKEEIYDFYKGLDVRK